MPRHMKYASYSSWMLFWSVRFDFERSFANEQMLCWHEPTKQSCHTDGSHHGLCRLPLQTRHCPTRRCAWTTHSKRVTVTDSFSMGNWEACVFD